MPKAVISARFCSEASPGPECIFILFYAKDRRAQDYGSRLSEQLSDGGRATAREI
jgi:hypothetical protein